MGLRFRATADWRHGGQARATLVADAWAVAVVVRAVARRPGAELRAILRCARATGRGRGTAVSDGRTGGAGLV